MSTDSCLKVLIVDDSAIIRQLLTEILRTCPKIQVVGTAKDGREALEKTRDLRPDVITLDVEMPVMSGLEALPGLVGIYHKPVVMVSSLTQEGAETTLQALELGAVDFVPKPGSNPLARMREDANEIIDKVLAAGSSQIRIAPARPKPAKPLTTATASQPVITNDGPAKPKKKLTSSEAPPRHVVVLGISTGGPQALNDTLVHLEPPIPPVLIVQHMPAKFTTAFAKRLNAKCGVEVREATSGDRLQNDLILIAPGGKQMHLIGKTIAMARIEINDEEPPVSGHKPSIDYLFESVVPIFGSAVTAILMTGMGRDGVRGTALIRAAGGSTFGQDEATSTVYGMNKAGFLEGAVQTQFPLEKLPSIIRHAWVP